MVPWKVVVDNVVCEPGDYENREHVHDHYDHYDRCDHYDHYGLHDLTNQVVQSYALDEQKQKTKTKNETK